VLCRFQTFKRRTHAVPPILGSSTLQTTGRQSTATCGIERGRMSMSHSLSAEKRLQEERQREDRIKELLESYKQVSTFMCVYFLCVHLACVRACARGRISLSCVAIVRLFSLLFRFSALNFAVYPSRASPSLSLALYVVHPTGAGRANDTPIITPPTPRHSTQSLRKHPPTHIHPPTLPPTKPCRISLHIDAWGCEGRW